VGRGRELEGVTVVLVEDDDDTREVLTLGLRLHGARVVPAATAAQAMEILRRNDADVLLSDIGLPDEDGFTLIRRLRALPADAGRIPAAAVTAYTLGDSSREVFTAGFQRFFRKPVDTRSLFDAVADLAREGKVERRRAERRLTVQSLEEDRRVCERRERHVPEPQASLAGC
jgi:CheY-like chemotaxis protein